MNIAVSMTSLDAISPLQRLMGLNKWTLDLRTNQLRLEYGRRFDKMKVVEIDVSRLAEILTIVEMQSLTAHWEEAVQKGYSGPKLVPFASRERIGAKVESACAYHRNGEERFLLGIFRRPNEEPKLAKNNRLLVEALEAFIENSPSCIVVADHNGGVVSVNRAFAKFIGRERKSELLRMPLQSVMEAFNPGLSVVIREAIQAPRPVNGRYEVIFDPLHRQTIYWRCFPLSLAEAQNPPKVFAFEANEGGPRVAPKP